MENSYYTPDTQEEVVLYIMDNLVIWTSDINPTTKEPFELRFNKNAVTALNSLLQISDVVHFANGSVEYNFSPANFKIKHLDKDDIKYFGFEEDFERSFPNYKLYNNWKLCFFIPNKYSLDYFPDTSKIIINDIEGRIFKGTIKNKSELKKLLKQLKIL